MQLTLVDGILVWDYLFTVCVGQEKAVQDEQGIRTLYSIWP